MPACIPALSLRSAFTALAAFLVVALGAPSAGSEGQASREPAERPQVAGRALAMDDLVAWCIVPFDSRKRTPEERIAMLQRLRFKRYAYDWRTEHLPDTVRELRLARDHGIGSKPCGCGSTRP